MWDSCLQTVKVLAGLIFEIVTARGRNQARWQIVCTEHLVSLKCPINSGCHYHHLLRKSRMEVLNCAHSMDTAFLSLCLWESLCSGAGSPHELPTGGPAQNSHGAPAVVHYREGSSREKRPDQISLISPWLP